jgi:D-xylose 1-dehydrogenase (NADP+, D-xylono-1,5-lactone-forming)
MRLTPQSPLRIGILGTADIARSFIVGTRPSKSVVVNSVASRKFDKATLFAHEMAIPRVYGSYAELLADPEVDAVYNPLPNALHAEWSIRAVRAGKHVLCEKPLAANSIEVRAMFSAAQEHGVHLVEGFPYRAQPHALKLKELIGSGAIGRVHTVQAAFGFTVADANNIRLNRNLAGGALLDAGTYPVSLVRMVSGERATRIHAAARWHPSGVDQTIVAMLEHPSGLLAQICCSFSTGVHRHAVIGGSDGVIQTTFLNNPPPDGPALLQLKRGVSWEAVYEAVEVPSCNGFLVEAESFERLIRHGSEHWTGASPAESLDIAMTLDAIMESAHTGQPVSVDS